YQESAGSWDSVAEIDGARDVVIVPQDDGDRLYVGTLGSAGIVLVKSAADKTERTSQTLSSPPIQRLAYDSNNLWALTEERNGLQSLLLWPGGEGNAETVWEGGSGGPSGDQFRSCVWVGFLEDSLWCVTPDTVWKYGTQKHSW